MLLIWRGYDINIHIYICHNINTVGWHAWFLSYIDNHHGIADGLVLLTLMFADALVPCGTRASANIMVMRYVQDNPMCHTHYIRLKMELQHATNVFWGFFLWGIIWRITIHSILCHHQVKTWKTCYVASPVNTLISPVFTVKTDRNVIRQPAYASSSWKILQRKYADSFYFWQHIWMSDWLRWVTTKK